MQYKGIIFTGLEKVAVYGINFVQGVMLARLLSPEDFGLTAMLGIFLGLGGLLAESGLGTALIVFDAEQMRRRVFFWNIGLALIIYALLVLAAPWIQAWYGKPILAPLMYVMALGIVINAASSVATARLMKMEKFGCLAWANSVSTIVAASIAIYFAYRGWGVWSIVWMSIIGAVVRTGLVWLFNRRQAEYPPCTSEKSFGELLRYGLKLMVSGILHVAYTESYNLVIGKMWSPAVVGLFVRGKRWAEIPGNVMGEAVGRVALPILVTAEKENALARESLRFTLINAALLWPCLIILGILTPEIVTWVLGEKWLDCVIYLRILLVGQFFCAFGHIALQTIKASGHSGILLKTDIWKMSFGAALLICGIPFGIKGLCWASVGGTIIETIACVIYAVKVKKCGKEHLR